jgi:hypothetical protein
MNALRYRTELVALVLCLGLLGVACGQQPRTPEVATDAPADPVSRSVDQNPPAAEPPPAAAAPEPSFVTVRVPAGTELEIELTDTLSSGVNHVGDPVRARLAGDLIADGMLVAAAGTELVGSVTEVVPLKKFGGQPRISVAFDSLQLESGDSLQLQASHTETGKKQAGRDAAKIGGSAAAGAVIGHQVDDDKGTELGAVVGGVIGTVVAAKTGKEVELTAGSTITVAVQEELQIRVPS